MTINLIAGESRPGGVDRRRPGGLVGDGFGGFFEVVGDFEDAGGVGGEGGDVAGH